ncbi:MAG TPA: aminotransferase class V-fold PLP-dependent enzyme [Gemmatimonadales bacterium]
MSGDTTRAPGAASGSGVRSDGDGAGVVGGQIHRGGGPPAAAPDAGPRQAPDRRTVALRGQASSPSFDAAALRGAEFPGLEGVAYLDSASVGPYPSRAREAHGRFEAVRAAPQNVTLDMQLGTLRRARALFARTIGAGADEIVLAHNTSDGINLAARALPFRDGDVVVTSDGEFPANVYPWMALASRGVRLELVPRRDDLPDEDALVAALDRPGVRALAISWVSFSTGYRVDLARLGRECRARGIWFVVDGIQGVGTMPLDVRACDVDILASGAQKWLLSPWGTGFAYVRRELVTELEPPAAGWLQVEGAEDFSRLTDYELAWRDDARRFEVGTLPYQDFAAAVASMELMLEVGIDAIAAHVATLVDRVVEWASARPRVNLVTPVDRDRRAAIVTIAMDDARATSDRLREAGVIHSFREGALRFSPHCFNTVEDVERALEVLERR